MTQASSPQAVLDEITALKRGDDLARLVHTVAFAAADERRASLADGVAELAGRAGLTPEDAETSFGNALRALERGGAEAAGTATRALLSGLLARGVALSPPVGAEAQVRVAEALLWLAAHTSADALSAIDAALGDKAAGIWIAVAALVRKIDAGSLPLLGRPGALVGAASLRESTSSTAHLEAEALAGEVRDPVVKALLSVSSSDGGPASSGATPGLGGSVGRRATVTGELLSTPRGPVALVLLGVTGILALVHVLRLVARLALRYRRPAELQVTAKSLILKTHTELLGRTLRERVVVIPVESLLRLAREVRYPRLGLYAGLFALAVGSYCGISLLIDGVRAGSPELIGIAALLLAAGVGLDFLLENAGSGMRGKHRIVVVPRKGPALALGDVDAAAADAALKVLAPPAS
jgi:hypothetical protein